MYPSIEALVVSTAADFSGKSDCQFRVRRSFCFQKLGCVLNLLFNLSYDTLLKKLHVLIVFKCEQRNSPIIPSIAIFTPTDTEPFLRLE